MTTRLEKAFDAARKILADRQEDIAEVVETVEQEPAYAFTLDQVKEVEQAIEQADAGNFATDQEVEELFARFGRV